MPSRKKAEGQARKAAKVKKEEALQVEKAREVEEVFRELEQTQIQRLQISNEQATCTHGFDPFPDDHVCSKFIRAFVREFYKRMRKYPSLRQAEKIALNVFYMQQDLL